MSLDPVMSMIVQGSVDIKWSCHMFSLLPLNLFAFSVLAALPGTALVPAQVVSAADQAAPPSFIIEANDILEIFVWKEPDLSRKVLVRPDGYISFPLVQDIKASGMTPAELKDQLEIELKEYLTAPNVTVIVDAIRHYRIYVTGKVQGPSSFILEKPITVLQAISLAGGLQEFADESEVKIVRPTSSGYSYLDFDYKEVIKGKKTDQNIYLESGDVVVVP